MFRPNPHGQPPTLLVYGTPPAPDYHYLSKNLNWGLTLDNGSARDVVFAMYENFARADGILCYPNANPVHIVSLIAESEVGHPMIRKDWKKLDELPKPIEGRKGTICPPKPIVFCGPSNEWDRFRGMFSVMREQKLFRIDFEDVSHPFEDVVSAVDYIGKNISESIPLTRAHYYKFSKRPGELEYLLKSRGVTPSEKTVSCFGSAGTRDPAHLERCDRYAAVLVRNGCNILHGGGGFGLMQRLTDFAIAVNAYFAGVTVHESGAPKIFFERDTTKKIEPVADLHIASKDMLHRIEAYAAHSQMFVALDGGIGSVQEIFVVAELLSKNHDVVMYQTTDGRRVPKPLIVVNEGGIYTPVLQYLEQAGWHHLRRQIIEVDSTERFEGMLQEHYRLNPPARIERDKLRNFREDYGVTPAPEVAMELMRGPDLSPWEKTTGREPSRDHEIRP